MSEMASDFREARCNSDCRSQLKQIGLALANYHDIYGALPPAQVRLSDVGEAHSWRLLILPYWDRVQLYEQYDMTVPWDHANNAPVRDYRTTGFFYGCPSGSGDLTGTTNYFAIGDDSTAWPPNQPFSLDAITDNPAETILVIELPDSSHNWAAPRDLTLQELMSAGVSSHHPGHFNALFADLGVRSVRMDVAPGTLRALLTVSGGEKITKTDWQLPVDH